MHCIENIQMIWSSKERVPFSGRQIGLRWSHPQSMRDWAGLQSSWDFLYFCSCLCSLAVALWASDWQPSGSLFPEPWEIVGDPGLSFRNPVAQQPSLLPQTASEWTQCLKRETDYTLDTSLFFWWVFLCKYHQVQRYFILYFGNFGSSSPVSQAAPETNKWLLGKTGSAFEDLNFLSISPP